MNDERRPRQEVLVEANGWVVETLKGVGGSKPMSAKDNVVRDAIEALPAEYQLLIFDHFYERLSFREMAERYGWGAHETARRKLAVATKMVRQYIEERASA
jgi:DNA-directed RNA polymerase specialized sigma24 family protein